MKAKGKSHYRKGRGSQINRNFLFVIINGSDLGVAATRLMFYSHPPVLWRPTGWTPGTRS
jgi:hypothetical protein